MKRWTVVSIISVFLMVMLACGGGGRDAGRDLQINIVNDSPYDICYVYISPSADDSWGADQLGGNETIGTGQTQTFNMADGVYDIRLENCAEAVVATDWEVSTSKTITVGMGRNSAALLVVNDSSNDVCYIYISPTTAEDWGDDWMGEKEIIPPGEHRVFYVNPGAYDLMASDCTPEILAEEYGIDLMDELTWTLYDW